MSNGKLLDTNVVIDGLPVAGPTHVSIVTVLELHDGVALAKNPADRVKRSRNLTQLLRRYTPLPLDEDVAVAYTDIVAAVIAVGRTPKKRRNDLWIAATALVHGLDVCTSNADDYRGLESLVTVVTP
ncbi:PIN domain-containing protein [Kineococcus glutinatus]|uniref:PIN domain-containing protein n=1 Tax=Kineococcus glutinatus TaxID=1070872 RepID=A0ABP9HZD8_9ACTN